MADFEFEIPERVEHAIGDAFLEMGKFGSGQGVVVEEHHIDVAERAEFASSVAAEGEDGDGVMPARWGVGECAAEQVFEKNVDDRGAPVGGFEAGHSLAVIAEENLAFKAEEFFGAREDF